MLVYARKHKNRDPSTSVGCVCRPARSIRQLIFERKLLSTNLNGRTSHGGADRAQRTWPFLLPQTVFARYCYYRERIRGRNEIPCNYKTRVTTRRTNARNQLPILFISIIDISDIVRLSLTHETRLSSRYYQKRSFLIKRWLNNGTTTRSASRCCLLRKKEKKRERKKKTRSSGRIVREYKRCAEQKSRSDFTRSRSI